MHYALTFFVFVTHLAAAQGADPRLQKNDVAACVEAAKSYLRSNEYGSVEQEQELIGACRDVEPDCIRAVGDNLRSNQRHEAQMLLPLIRACRGKDMGKCYRAAIAKLSSYDYSQADQALSILKKCE